MVKNIKVLIVDDSAVVRQTLASIFEDASGIEVMDSSADPYYASLKIAQEVPDVITLDVEMPRMDGITFLQKIMSQHPIPVVICSSLVGDGTETAMKALEYGAVDVITKPALGAKKFLEDESVRIVDVVRGAAAANLKKLKVRKQATPIKATKKHSADVVLTSRKGRSMATTTEKIVAVGASTGGTEALRVFLEAMPYDTPGILIVQHMPEKFTKSLADRLNETCNVSVKEAEDGDTVLRGQALIAPGNKHMLLERSGARYYIKLQEGELVSRHRPSVDVLFRSTANVAGKNAIGVIMTGMGDDGAHGMKEMHEAGAYNLGQDESTCVVYGMPQEAFKLGGVDKQLPLQKLASAVLHREKQF